MNEDMFKKLSNMLESSNSSNYNANFNNSDNLKNIISNFVSSAQNNSSIDNNFGNTSNNNSSNSSSPSDNLNGFDFSNIDMETIMKIKNIMSKVNTKNDDPRSKLLMSLKPYLKPSKKEKLDQCMKFMSLSSVMEAFNNVGGDIKK